MLSDEREIERLMTGDLALAVAAMPATRLREATADHLHE